MATKMSAHLRELNSLSQSIDNASHQLGIRLSKLEEQLSALHLGTPVQVDLRGGQSPDSHELEKIGFGQHDGKGWKLLYGWGNPIDEHWREKPLVECPADIQVLAVEKLPELLIAIGQEAKRWAETINRAAADLE